MKLYRLFNTLSLDVVLGAALSLKLISQSLHKSVDAKLYIILGLATWMVYALDHLIDIWILIKKPIGQKYLFFYKYKSLMSISIMLSVISLFILMAVYLSWAQIGMGLLIGFFILIHYGVLCLFEVKQSIYLGKEFRIAAIYVLGVSFGVLPLANVDLWNGYFWVIGILYCLTCINLVVMAQIEQSNDRMNRQVSLSQFITNKPNHRLILILFAVFTLLLVAAFKNSGLPPQALAILALMGILHGLLYWQQSYFVRGDSHRLFSEAIYFCPIILFFL